MGKLIENDKALGERGYTSEKIMELGMGYVP